MQPSLPFESDGVGQVEFVRHPRARRYLIRVADDGTVRVTVPRWGSRRQAAAFAEQERAWIEKQRRRLAADPDTRRAPLPPAVEYELRERAKRGLPARLLALAAVHALRVTRVSVRNQQSRWGSCSRRGTISLNWRLVQVPRFVREYVLVHELMHRRELNHSARFWRHVAAACPRYVEARRWLRIDGAGLF